MEDTKTRNVTKPGFVATATTASFVFAAFAASAACFAEWIL
jgi:hypothetical protein